MVGSRLVEANEILSIQREHCSPLPSGRVEHRPVIERCARVTLFLERHDVVAHCAECDHDGECETFVCKELRHAVSGSLVVANYLVDFTGVRAHVRPRLGKIRGAQRSVRSHQVRVRRAAAPSLFEHPDGDPRPDDTCLPATDPRRFLDAGEVIAEIADDPLQHTSLLGSRHLRKKALNFIQAARHA
jgi:hypothetical protein